MRAHASLALVVALALPVQRDAPTPGTAGQGGPLAPAWRELTFSARKLLLAASTRVTVTAIDRDQLALRMPPSRDGKVPTAGRFVRITTRTLLPFGRSEETSAIIESGSGEWLQTDKLVRGHGDYGKTLRATVTGAYVWRIAPRDGREATAPPDAWTRRKESVLIAAPGPPAGLVVTDPYALLYLISQAGLGVTGGSRSWLLLSPEGLSRVDVAAGGLRRIHVSYERDWGGGGGDRVHRDVTAREVVVSAAAVTGGGGTGGAELELLGLRGNLRVLVDATSDVPLEIRGRSEALGEVTVRLTGVVLAAPPGTTPGG